MQNKKPKILIIGAGITGLTCARILKENFDVTVLERRQVPGGIARTKEVNGCSYHTVGGHCFNSKNEKVMDFVFKNVMPYENWHRVERNAKIQFKGNLISYPIEYAMKEIATIDLQLAIQAVTDFIEAKEKNEYIDLADWFRSKFGKTLAENYFIPYNNKIWNVRCEEMSPEWVKDKLPIPDKESFVRSLFSNEKDNMPHGAFLYPNSNTQNTFIDNLAKGVNIQYGADVKEIRKAQNYWLIDNIECDLIINTMPLNELIKKIVSVPKDVQEAGIKLKYNKITNMLWESEEREETWIYFPENNTIFHRHINIGNFFYPRKNFTITEAIGERTKEEMISEGMKISGLIKPLDYSLSNHAYVVYDKNRTAALEKIKKFLKSINLNTVGRFGEWEYYNMDICMEKAMILSESIIEKYALKDRV